MHTLRYIGQADNTGYGIAAATLVRALDGAGVAVAWEPLVDGPNGYAPDRSMTAGPADLWRLRDDAADCDRVLLHMVPEYYAGFIARERASSRPDAPIWGMSVWETDRLPDHWPPLINELDGLVVPSDWNRDIYRASGVTIPIAVVPYLPQFAGAPSSAEATAALAARLPQLEGRLVFYAISAWLERKGIAPLVAAFAGAFRHRDPVALIIKTTARDLDRYEAPGTLPVRQQFVQLLYRAMRRHWRRPPLIVLLAAELPEAEIHALHEMGDCYVSLCRAEGWGLGAFDAGFMGKPVIMTDWGGQSAFLSAETSYKVASRQVSVRTPLPNASYTSNQHWAEPNDRSAVAAFRAVAADPGSARARGAALRADLQARFTPTAAANAMIGALWPD